MSAVTRITGDQVDSASEAYRLECEARELLRRNTTDRREYLAAVERKRGTEACEELKAVFLKLWEAKPRKGA
jgi:hypothetical protein